MSHLFEPMPAVHTAVFVRVLGVMHHAVQLPAEIIRKVLHRYAEPFRMAPDRPFDFDNPPITLFSFIARSLLTTNAIRVMSAFARCIWQKVLAEEHLRLKPPAALDALLCRHLRHPSRRARA